MVKVGRNEACPCGSGKKYKKCCLENEVVSEAQKEELLEMAEGLIAYTEDYYEDDMEDELEPMCHQEDAMHLHQDENFQAGYLAWRTFHSPPDSQLHPFESFILSYKEESVPPGFDVGSWQNSTPSFFEVTGTAGNMGEVEDLFLREKYKVLFMDMLNKGDLFAGVVLEAGPSFKLAFGLHTDLSFLVKEEIVQIVAGKYEEYLKGRGKKDLRQDFLREQFPHVLLSVYTLAVDRAISGLVEEIDFDDGPGLGYKEILSIFLRKARKEKLYSLDTLREVAELWQEYTEEESPRINKIAAVVAALEYHASYLEERGITQKTLAQEYGVTAATISRWHTKLVDYSYDQYFWEDEDDATEHEPVFMNTVNSERYMNKVKKILQGKDFSSMEEMNRFLQDNMELINQGGFDDEFVPVSNREKAEELLYDAYEAPLQERIALAKQALDVYPNSPDAYVILADAAATPEEALKLYKRGVLAGEEDLGKAVFAEEKGNFWSIMETRPYMRAKLGYAHALDSVGLEEEAVKQLQEMLELNPQDNQGVRYNLLTILLEGDKYKQAKKLLADHEEESTEFSYNQVLAEYGLRGLTFHLKAMVNEAKRQNPHVPAYLLGKKTLPDVPPAYVGIGDRNAAISYVYQNGHLWQDKKDLLALLKS